MTILQHFLKPQYNQRSDEYGGSLKNRVRLTKEILIDVKEAVGQDCAIAFRFATDELMGPQGLRAESEGRDVVAMLAEIPDLWDVNISDWGNDSATARFEPNEGYQEPYTAFVKSLTSKPVVGVGRFTSADAMLSQINRGVLDLIGAARPSIADPFLPRKIDQGRFDEIRECIGCNICVAQDLLSAPIRCTQNPTQGEEWKQNWHPEKIDRAASEDPVLVVGAGPAGLESALQLANRGYAVTLAEAADSLGGRIASECGLPGLASYARVRDYRENLLRQKANVDIYVDNRLSAQDVIDLEIPRVLIATGSSWRNDGVGRQHHFPIDGVDSVDLLTPDDVLAGAPATGRVLIYDDDHYYMASTIAERYREQGHEVCLLTPASMVSAWTEYTLEQAKIQRRLLELGTELQVSRELLRLDPGCATVADVYGAGKPVEIAFDTLVLVTSRISRDQLYRELLEFEDRFKTLRAIGDCHAPGTIAAAVYDGHAAARYLESGEDMYAPLYTREMPQL